MKLQRILLLLFLLAVTAAAFYSCKKIFTVLPGELSSNNPFDTIQYRSDLVPEIPVDSNSFLGIHKYILSVKCATLGCHDGAFEPDYRTVQSAYNTLVYASVVKIDTVRPFPFKYRVVPGDTTLSWLHERITTDDTTLGRMPLYDTLYPSQIQKINNWIMAGAPDIFGNIMKLPNSQPTLFGIVALLPDNGDKRVDTIRSGVITNPFAVPKNSNITLWFAIYDDKIPFVFKYNKIKFSKNPFDFSASPELPLVKEAMPTNLPAFNGQPFPCYLHYTVNTSQYNTGDIVYIQVYVQDGDHSKPVEIPGRTFYLESYMSFIVQ